MPALLFFNDGIINAVVIIDVINAVVIDAVINAVINDEKTVV